MPMLFASLFLSLTSAIPADDEVLKVYDLRALLRSPEEKTYRARLPIDLPIRLPGSGFSENRGPGVDIELGYTWSPLGSSQLDEWLRHPSIGLSDSDDQRYWGRFEHGRLIVLAPPEVHDRIAKLLAVLERELLSSVAIEVWRVDPMAHLQGQALTAEEVARLQEDGVVHLIGESVARAGRPANLRAASSQTYLQDYDVEVAQSSRMADPQIGLVDTGFQATLVVNRTHEDRWLVRAGLRNDDFAEPIRSTLLVGEELGRIQLPAIRTQIALVSGEVENGGALLVGSDSRSSYLVRVHREEPRGPVDNDFWSLLPVASLLEPMQPEWLEVPVPSIKSGVFQFGGEADEAQSDRGLLNTFEILCEDEAGVSLRQFGDHVLLPPGAELAQRARGLLEQLTPEGSSGLQVEVAYGTPETPALRRFDLSQIGADALAASLSRHCRIPTRPGDQFRWVDGTERTYLADHDPELAEEAESADPVIATFLEGLAIEGALQKRRDGLWSVESRLHYCEPGSRISPFQVSGKLLSDLDMVHATSTEARPAVSLPSGVWTVIHRASLPIEETRTERPWVCLIRISEP